MAKDVTFLHAENEDSDRTVRIHRLICVFVVRMSDGAFSNVAAHRVLEHVYPHYKPRYDKI